MAIKVFKSRYKVKKAKFVLYDGIGFSVRFNNNTNLNLVILITKV